MRKIFTSTTLLVLMVILVYIVISYVNRVQNYYETADSDNSIELLKSDNKVVQSADNASLINDNNSIAVIQDNQSLNDNLVVVADNLSDTVAVATPATDNKTEKQQIASSDKKPVDNASKQDWEVSSEYNTVVVELNDNDSDKPTNETVTTAHNTLKDNNSAVKDTSVEVKDNNSEYNTAIAKGNKPADNSSTNDNPMLVTLTDMEEKTIKTDSKPAQTEENAKVADSTPAQTEEKAKVADSNATKADKKNDEVAKVEPVATATSGTTPNSTDIVDNRGKAEEKKVDISGITKEIIWGSYNSANISSIEDVKFQKLAKRKAVVKVEPKVEQRAEAKTAPEEYKDNKADTQVIDDIHTKVIQGKNAKYAIDNKFNVYKRFADGWFRISAEKDRKPTARTDISVAIASDKIYMIGGWSYGSTYFNDTWFFDIADNRWHSLGKTRGMKPRAYQSVTVVGDKIYMIGGYNGEFLKDTWVLDVNSDKWSEVPAVGEPIAMAHQSARLLGSSIYLTDGYDPNSNEISGIWVFDIPDSRWRELTVFSGDNKYDIMIADATINSKGEIYIDEESSYRLSKAIKNSGERGANIYDKSSSSSPNKKSKDTIIQRSDKSKKYEKVSSSKETDKKPKQQYKVEPYYNREDVVIVDQ